MTDHDLEQRLRAWYRADVDERETAPFKLRDDLRSLAQSASTTRRIPSPGWRFPAVLRFAPLVLAAAAVTVIVVVGIGQLVGPPNVGPPLASGSSSPPSASPSAPAASATESERVYGWPSMRAAGPGLYSWDGSRCGVYGPEACSMGFMHNGYGSGDVDINITGGRAGNVSAAEGTAVTVAGHDGIYRLIDAGTEISPMREQWLVEIEGTTISIVLSARPGTSEADLAEAHAIIDSMFTEPRDTDLGFRLVFRLETDDWDSG